MSKVVARLIYDSSTAQSVDTGNAIAFASTTLDGSLGYTTDGLIQLKKPGTYVVHANFTALATASGNIGVEMVEGLTAVAGANATQTASASGDYVALSFSAASTVRASSTQSYASLYFAPTVDTSFTAANVIIERVN